MVWDAFGGEERRRLVPAVRPEDPGVPQAAEGTFGAGLAQGLVTEGLQYSLERRSCPMKAHPTASTLNPFPINRPASTISYTAMGIASSMVVVEYGVITPSSSIAPTKRMSAAPVMPHTANGRGTCPERKKRTL
jgi:hypothetical protein